MKTFATIFLLFFGLTASAQTSLQGKVTDADSGEPIIFGTVALYKNGILVTGTEADLDGFYSITEIDPGRYDVDFSSTGYHIERIEGVTISRRNNTMLNFEMSAGICGYSIILYVPPAYEPSELTQGFNLFSDDLRHMPFR